MSVNNTVNVETIELSAQFSSVVVRPRPDQVPQILVFMENEARELCPTTRSDGHPTFRLSSWFVSLGRSSHAAVYEPVADSIYFVASATAIMRLDAKNTISLAAGSEKESGLADGVGKEARFEYIRALAADGKGNVFTAEKTTIRVLEVNSGRVTTLEGTKPTSNFWNAITYDAASDALVAATAYAVCRIPLARQGDRVLSASDKRRNDTSNTEVVTPAATSPHLIGGAWAPPSEAAVNGHGTDARFNVIISILAGAQGSLYIADRSALRHMAPTGLVTTVCGADLATKQLCQLTFLSHHQLAAGIWCDNSRRVTVFSSSGFAPNTEGLTACIPGLGDVIAQLPSLLLMPTESEAGTPTAGPGMVRVTVGGGKAYMAHRAALVARSDYFRRYLAPDGGFADSGSAEVSILHADPDAFGAVLGYMYTGRMHVPAALLRPVVELAEQLLLPPECSRELQLRLREATGAATVVPDLMWAERHGLRELVSFLRSYLLQQRREVAAHGWPAGFSTQCPELADEVIRALLEA